MKRGKDTADRGSNIDAYSGSDTDEYKKLEDESLKSSFYIIKKETAYAVSILLIFQFEHPFSLPFPENLQLNRPSLLLELIHVLNR